METLHDRAKALQRTLQTKTKANARDHFRLLAKQLAHLAHAAQHPELAHTLPLPLNPTIADVPMLLSTRRDPEFHEDLHRRLADALATSADADAAADADDAADAADLEAVRAHLLAAARRAGLAELNADKARVVGHS